MNAEQVEKLAKLIPKAQAGDSAAKEALADGLFKSLYPDAKLLLRGNNVGLTLRTQDLVQEVVASLFAGRFNSWPEGSTENIAGWLHSLLHNRLIDYLRRRNAAKRHGNWDRTALDDVLEYHEQRLDGGIDDFIEALERLKAVSPLQEEIARLWFFSELDPHEIAVMLKIDLEKVENEWDLAHARLRAWVKSRLQK